MTARAAAAVPFATAADLLAELAGIRLPAKRIERIRRGRRRRRRGPLRGRVRRDRAPARSACCPPTAARRRTSSTSPSTAPACRWCPPRSPTAPARPSDGRARTREVKLACLFTQTKIDTDGRPVRDPDSTSYLASFAPAAEFATLVHAEARRRGADHIRQLVVLGDGAPWIWNLATAILPEATPIVDLYHAREHLHDLAAQLAGVLGDAHPDWLAARLADLDAGDIETLVAETDPAAPRLPDDTANDTAKRWGTSKPTPTGCAMPTSANTACSSAPASSRPAAKPSSDNA